MIELAEIWRNNKKKKYGPMIWISIMVEETRNPISTFLNSLALLIGKMGVPWQEVKTKAFQKIQNFYKEKSQIEFDILQKELTCLIFSITYTFWLHHPAQSD